MSDFTLGMNCGLSNEKISEGSHAVVQLRDDINRSRVLSIDIRSMDKFNTSQIEYYLDKNYIQ